jgi:hypothetical protein
MHSTLNTRQSNSSTRRTSQNTTVRLAREATLGESWVRRKTSPNSRISSSSKNLDLSESEYWNTISPNYRGAYYQQIVAVAILWKRTETIVSTGRGDWYEGDYRPQIVAYSLALLFHSLRRSGSEFDLGQVWARQGIDGFFENCIRNLAIAVQKAILSPPQGMTNVGEWSKKEACWESIRQSSVSPVQRQIDQWIVSKEDFKKAKADGKKLGVQDDGIGLQKTVLDLTSLWLLGSNCSTGHKRPICSLPAERNLVIKASTVQGFMKINMRRSWRKLLEIKQLCEEEGFRKG